MSTMQFNLFFNNHTVYVTFEDGKFFKLNQQDLSKEEVNELPRPTKVNPIMVLRKNQFDVAKSFLMAIDNPFRIDVETARIYSIIGFITNDEFLSYKNAVEGDNWR